MVAGKKIGCLKLAAGDYRKIRIHAAATPDTSYQTPGFNEKGRKTLAHPDHRRAQDWWHPTLNQGTQPANYTHKSRQRVWLLCPGCIHGCGRRHEWDASVFGLTQRGGDIVCPFCDSKMRKFCHCRSVAADARLSREWHPHNPPPELAAKCISSNVLWKCPKGHQDYKARCNVRSTNNTGCPACFRARQGKVRHPVLSEGRPDLASHWHPDNDKAASEVTLGSNLQSWWVCDINPDHPPWQARVFSRALYGTSCPECSKKQRFGPRIFFKD